MLKIILSGGGTLGSVSPLIAIFEEFKNQGYECEFLWVGTSNGPEIEFVAQYNIPYVSIPSGKFRRYIAIQNFFDPLIIFFGFVKSIFIISRFKPSIILSAGGFVSVPLVFAGWLLRVPCLIHQQDARRGLANRFMAPFAKKITVTLEKSLKDFNIKKTAHTGNPVRKDLVFLDTQKAFEYFGLAKDVPVVLVLGGGTGAATINSLVLNSLQSIVEYCQIIHSTGHGKMNVEAKHSRYKSFEFLSAEDLKMAYACADLVISRAGMSTLTELAYLGKPTILIPIPNGHQEENAYEFGRYNACEILNQQELDPKSFSDIIKDILFDSAFMHDIARNIGKVMPRDASERVVNEIMKIIKK